MPVPRRFDRRPPERDLTRINERIRVPEVRLIGEDGSQIGVIKTEDALAYAQERDLDLVEVAPEAKPPVCRVLDYSKYKYEQAQKQKAARKHQQQITIREIKFRPKIAQHDYDTKKGHVERFLKHRDKVKITIMFRGREVTHPERGTMILNRLAEELAELAVVEQNPTQDGRNMTMMLAPSKAVLGGQFDASGGAADGQAAVTSTDGKAPAEEPAPATEPAAVAGDGKPAAVEQTADATGEESTTPATEPATTATEAPEAPAPPAPEPAADQPAPAKPPRARSTVKKPTRGAAKPAADEADAAQADTDGKPATAAKPARAKKTTKTPAAKS